MKNKKQSNNKTIIFSIVFTLIGILVGLGLSFVLFNYGDNKIINTKPSKYSTKFNSLYETYETLKSEYYKDLDDEKLIEGAIKGMIEATGDEHTMFFTKQQKEDFETSLAGSYYGIGAQVIKVDDDTVITRTFDNSPAQKAGLKPGDIISKVDGEDVKGQELSDVVAKLKSDKKKTADVVIIRDNEEINITLEKAIIDLPSISTDMFDDHIGYIYVSIFGENTDQEFSKALDELKEKGMDKLIIDLRDNSGGYLSTVTYMLDKFVDKDTVIYQIKEKDRIDKYTALTNEKLDYKVVILVNGESASASEIMASALKEQYGATLVGTKTFGKGTVQQMKDLANGTLIKYTTEEWLTSNGNSIEKEGITPDVEIELNEEYYNDMSDESDNQLQKALELLR